MHFFFLHYSCYYLLDFMKFIKPMNHINKPRVDHTFCNCVNITFISILDKIGSSTVFVIDLRKWTILKDLRFLTNSLSHSNEWTAHFLKPIAKSRSYCTLLSSPNQEVIYILRLIGAGTGWGQALLHIWLEMVGLNGVTWIVISMDGWDCSTHFCCLW